MGASGNTVRLIRNAVGRATENAVGAAVGAIGVYNGVLRTNFLLVFKSI